MSWDRPTVAAALVDVLDTATADTVSVFANPPATFNPPALVCQFPQTVTLHSPAFATDLATTTVLAAVGLPEADNLDELLSVATGAIDADPTLGGVVQNAKPFEWRNWRVLSVGGAEVMSAELALQIQM